MPKRTTPPYVVAASIVAMAVLVFSSSMAGSAFARASTDKIHVTLPFDETDFIDCTNENVDFTGNMHILLSVTSADNDNGNLLILMNGQGIRGVGESSGNLYSFPLQVKLHETVAKGETADINVKAILTEQGVGKVGYTQLLLHATYNADGTLTAQVVKSVTTCL